MTRFTAYDDDLKPYTILQAAPASSAVHSHVDLVTEDGRPVRRIDRGEYDIIHETATIRVWSDDPSGP